MAENKIGKFYAERGPASGWKCAFCKGSGIQPRSLKSRCFPCRGKGEVEFANPIKCPLCQGMGITLSSSLLSCIHCRGVGMIEAIEKYEKGEDVVDIIRKRFGEIAKRLKWIRKETEKRTKDVEKRLKPINPFISARGESAFGGKELKKETQWLEKLGNKIKKGWQSFWEN